MKTKHLVVGVLTSILSGYVTVVLLIGFIVATESKAPYRRNSLCRAKRIDYLVPVRPMACKVFLPALDWLDEEVGGE